MRAVKVKSPSVNNRYVPRLPHPSWSPAPQGQTARVRTAGEFWARLGL